MKKSTLLLAATFAFFLSCSEEEIYLESIDEVGTVTGIAGEQNSDEVFLIVEEPPTFPGGVDAYKSHLLTNLKYPERAKNEGIEGNVFVSFVVTTEGKLENIQVVKGVGSGCDEEAVRMLLTSPDWIPGKQRGRLVNARMNLRVAFSLSGNATQVQDEGAQVMISTPAI